jgi:uncharacterized protein (TIGR03382 family)
VQALREFRDRHLLTTPAGRAFVAYYYAHSPGIAAFIAKHDTARAATRVLLTPVVFSVEYPLSAMVAFALLAVVWVLRRRRITSRS